MFFSAPFIAAVDCEREVDKNIVSNGHCVDNASVVFDAHRVPTLAMVL